MSEWERGKLVLEANLDSNIQSTKAMEVCERSFLIFEFLCEFSEQKWKMTTVWERTKMCVYTSLSISRVENILDIHFKGWVRVALKKGRYLKPAHTGEQKLPAFL